MKLRHGFALCALALVLPCGLGFAKDLRDETQWLERVQSAPQRVSYTGIFVYQQGQSMQSSRVTHMVDGSDARERLEVLDGQPREILRHNGEVRCVLPESKTLLIERSEQRDAFPALIQTSANDVSANYLIKRMGVERVAGLECDIVELEPRDGLRYGYRLWTERATGLLLKAQMINDKGSVVEQTAFSEVHIGGNIDRSLLKARWNTDGWKVEDASSSASTLPGWGVARAVSGFRKIREVRRTLAGHADAGQIVFSDGMAAISIFIEPLGADRSEPETVATQGAINMISRRYADHRLTVLGEAPMTSIRFFANAVEFKPSLSKP